MKRIKYLYLNESPDSAPIEAEDSAPSSRPGEGGLEGLGLAVAQ